VYVVALQIAVDRTSSSPLRTARQQGFVELT
jgi:hypothetical protein